MSRKPIDISIIRNYATTKGGLLLSTEYVNSRSKLLWQCKEGHQWKAAWHSIKIMNSWCPTCVGLSKPSICILQQHAINKGGLLLSTEYVNSRSKLLWQCKEGHQWKAKWYGLGNRDQWCPYCVGLAKPNISVLQQYAINKGGLLLSAEYINSKTTLLWQCKEGHQWNAYWDTINNAHHWCPACSGNAKPNISMLQQYAINKGGLLLSTSYINNNTNLLWQCKEGHQWESKWNYIKDGNTWCPECSSFKTEKLVRSLLESKLEVSLTKYRFIYDNKRYEFDGYNKEHKIAFEYQGYQHYIYPNRWHKTKEIFLKAQQRDRDKVQYCKENNITLFIIPHTENKNLESYVTMLVNKLELR